MSELITYVRVQKGRNKGKLRGVVVAVDRLKVGWSQANEKAGDKFNKERGIAIARTRAINGLPEKGCIPHEVNKAVAIMAARSEKYFKAE